MIPNRFIIFWNNIPIGIDNNNNNSGGYPFKTENPNQIKYWNSKVDAIKYSDLFPNHVFRIAEIQFRIVG